ncbi:hypothetical protein KBY65_01015 [Cyanobium sp. Alchichica 3B3-8F6]|uniref:hypothetical protein n=1 Tax=unclassified Cyanobium TaxID=2627006 RepID=UPI0020CB8E23|nr:MULTISPECIES: hypothetical protein [unclassified Cyanobium]MCP9881062.1 hypothetical protein [Cyanobium sp. Alchichica 3B3-8F6]MCP9941018.1 hypothetical protein [Cyanobium sp. ATX 6E8]
MRSRRPSRLDRPHGQVSLRVLSGLLALLGAGLVAQLSRPGVEAPPLPPPALSQPAAPSSALEASLLQQLAVADQQWIPRAETLANGAIRYHYRRRADQPTLSVAELRALIANPPSFGVERQAIAELLSVLATAGVRLELTEPHKLGAAGEWDPQARTLRIQPRVVEKGSAEFATVLNHEAIHVAQSCRNRGVRSSPRLLGLPTALPAHLAGVLNDPVYRQASAHEQQLEREAYANQAQSGLGAQLVRQHC